MNLDELKESFALSKLSIKELTEKIEHLENGKEKLLEHVSELSKRIENLKYSKRRCVSPLALHCFTFYLCLFYRGRRVGISRQLIRPWHNQ